MIYIFKVYKSSEKPQTYIKLNVFNCGRHFYIPLNIQFFKFKTTFVLKVFNFKFVEINKKAKTRLLFEFEDFVVKVPLFKKIKFGWKKNIKEHQLSKLFDYVCPVKLSLFFSFLIVSKHALSISDKDFEKLDIEKYLFFKNKKESFGRIGKAIKIIK